MHTKVNQKNKNKMKTNDSNDWAKRTATQVKAILKANGIICQVENQGDGRMFRIELQSNIKNRVTLKQLGFLLCRGSETDKYINVKAF